MVATLGGWGGRVKGFRHRYRTVTEPLVEQVVPLVNQAVMGLVMEPVKPLMEQGTLPK